MDNCRNKGSSSNQEFRNKENNETGTGDKEDEISSIDDERMNLYDDVLQL